MRLITGLLVLTVCSVPAWAITLGQVDTFQTWSLQNWDPYLVGGVDPYLSGEVKSTGGPLGAGDGYMQLTANNKPLSAYNRANQWSGDYLAAGVSAISVDLANFGPSVLEIRIELEGGSIFQSSEAVVLPPDGQWQHVIFSPGHR